VGEDEGSLERGKLVLWGDAKGTAEYVSVLFPFSNPSDKSLDQWVSTSSPSSNSFSAAAPPKEACLPLRSCTLSKDVIVGSFVAPAQQSSP